MEGGVALFLLVILLVVGAVVAIALYATGGALTLSKDGETEEGKQTSAPEAPTSPTTEKVIFAGTEQDPRHRERHDD
jgi:flagellar basal body-associated protein FliL